MIASLLALSWMDLFVPTGISIVIILLSVAEKRSHVLYYIFGSYFTYVLASIAIFLGADIYVRRIWEYLFSTFPLHIGILKLCIGVCALVGFVINLRYVLQVLQKKRSFSFEKVLRIKSIHPFFILMIGVVQYLVALPSCINMFAFIAIMVSNDVTLLEAIIYLSIFCSVSILPKVVTYILSIVLAPRKFERVMEVMRRVLSAAFLASIPIMLLFIALWGSIAGIGDIILYS
jgi:hypothetical protein